MPTISMCDFKIHTQKQLGVCGAVASSISFYMMWPERHSIESSESSRRRSRRSPSRDMLKDKKKAVWATRWVANSQRLHFFTRFPNCNSTLTKYKQQRAPNNLPVHHLLLPSRFYNFLLQTQPTSFRSFTSSNYVFKFKLIEQISNTFSVKQSYLRKSILDMMA